MTTKIRKSEDPMGVAAAIPGLAPHEDEFTCALDQRESTEAEREAAREQYGCPDIQIDDDALTSVAVTNGEDDSAVWVQAWVYVRGGA